MAIEPISTVGANPASDTAFNWGFTLVPQAALTTLAHHIDIDWLREAYRRTRKDGARGVDGQSAQEYATNLENNLRSLLDRAKSGTYRAPPVRRVHIPKGDGSETRPIGIPTYEDKVLQRAVAMVLEAVYEQDFYDGSYGFRPARSAPSRSGPRNTSAVSGMKALPSQPTISTPMGCAPNDTICATPNRRARMVAGESIWVSALTLVSTIGMTML